MVFWPNSVQFPKPRERGAGNSYLSTIPCFQGNGQPRIIGTHLYSWVNWTPRLEPPTFRSAVKRTNHSATALHLCTNWWDAPLYTYSRVAISGTPPGDRSITVRVPADYCPIILLFGVISPTTGYRQTHERCYRHRPDVGTMSHRPRARWPWTIQLFRLSNSKTVGNMIFKLGMQARWMKSIDFEVTRSKVWWPVSYWLWHHWMYF